ncbi:hypothetical protein [Leptospira adleri]|uniref:hypothetical protein n=1 Tax=Leptospira adleri TaxID=2023186 RepID=UPI001083CF2B|nr:hypothetical protein [Leptospira adleri]TGM57730.1 hypothetical protein EHQ97_08550 [Leptospira adleri]
MKSRFVFATSLCLYCFFSFPPISAQDPNRSVGTCHSSLNQWIESIAGLHGSEDENLKTQKTSFKDGSFWLIDSTPSKNWDWYLLHPQKKDKLCLTLKTGAFGTKTVEKGRRQVVISKARGSGDFPTREITFVRDRGESVFQPRKCVEIRFREKRPVRKRVSCISFLE